MLQRRKTSIPLEENFPGAHGERGRRSFKHVSPSRQSNGERSPRRRVWWRTRSRSNAGKSRARAQRAGRRPEDHGRGPAALTSGLTGGPAARRPLQQVLRGRVRSGRLGGSRRSPRARAGAARAAGGGGSGKEAAGGGTPAPRAASPSARGEPLGVTSSGRPGAGPSTRLERRESPTPSLQLPKCTPQPGPPPHPQPRGGPPPARPLPAFPSGRV